MKKNHQLAGFCLGCVLALGGCDALIDERYPVPEGTYQVPKTAQLTRAEVYFENKANQENQLMQMREELPYNWK